MKKMLLMITLLVGGSTLKAQEAQSPVLSAGDLTELSFGDNMKVVLVPVEAEQESVHLNANAARSLQVTVSGSAMQIRQTGTKRAVVYVMVKNISTITLGENTTVLTSGILTAKNIKLFVDQGAVARLRTEGAIEAESLGDFDVTVSKGTVQASNINNVSKAF